MTQQLYSNYDLIEALKEGKTEAVKLLLQNDKTNINLQDNDGYTALMCASLEGKTEVVKLLLQNDKININLQDESGRTALIYALKFGRT